MRDSSPLILGERYGRLTALGKAGVDSRKNLLWNFKCDCGADYVTRATSVRNGYVTSCGCYRNEQARAQLSAYEGPSGNLKHGLRHTVEYETWARMHGRCSNPNNPKFADCGGRGIKVCERWSTFEPFLADMGLRPSDLHSLDRKIMTATIAKTIADGRRQTFRPATSAATSS